MENYWNMGKPNTPRLARILFAILVSIVVVTLGVLIFVKTYEIVRAERGEILAKNAPIQFIAPFDVDEQQFFVTEGASVKKGDTLAILQNYKLQSDYNMMLNELEMTQTNLDIYTQLRENSKDKTHHLKKNKYILRERYKSTEKRSENEQLSLKYQMLSAKKDVSIAKSNYEIDSALFAEKVIAKRKFDETKQAYLKEQRNYEQIKSTLLTGEINEKDQEEVYKGQINAEELKVIDAEQEYYNLQKDIATLQLRVRTLGQQLRQHQYNLERQYIIAEQDGNIRSLYNARQATNLLKTGDAVMVVSPLEKEEYYAKLSISQRAVKRIKVGQRVHIKPDAYDVLKYGPVRGEVTFVSDSDLNNNFYVLAKINPENLRHPLQNGFLAKADIITDKIRLIEFLLKNLFSDYDMKPTTDENNKNKSNKQ